MFYKNVCFIAKNQFNSIYILVTLFAQHFLNSGDTEVNKTESMPSRTLQFKNRDEYMVCDERIVHMVLRGHKEEYQSWQKGNEKIYFKFDIS